MQIIAVPVFVQQLQGLPVVRHYGIVVAGILFEIKTDPLEEVDFISIGIFNRIAGSGILTARGIKQGEGQLIILQDEDPCVSCTIIPAAGLKMLPAQAGFNCNLLIFETECL